MSHRQSPSKSKSPAAPQPGALDQQAQKWHSLIDESEQDIAPIYWRLGDTLNELRKERQFDWKALLRHCDDLDLRRSRVTRALRVKKRHPDGKGLDGKTLYEALGHKSRARQPVVHQEVGAPLTTPEYQAAVRFERFFKTRERAVEVLRAVFAGEKPAVDGKSAKGGTDDGEPHAGKPTNGKPAGGEPVKVAKPVKASRNGRHRAAKNRVQRALRLVGAPSSNGHISR